MENDELLNSLLDDLVGDATVKVEMEHKAKSSLLCKAERSFYTSCAEQSAKSIARTRAQILDLFHRIGGQQ